MNKHNRKSQRVVWLACAAMAGLGAGRFTRAADISWIGAAAPSNFGTPANWGGGAVPDAPDNAMINNGGIATVANGFTRTVTDLRLGAAPAGSGSLVQTGGTLIATGNMAFGSNTTGAGSLNLSGGALNVTASGLSGNFSIGDDGAGTATISGGVITARTAFLGKSTNGHGHVTQTGGTLAVQTKLVMAELKPNTGAFANPSDYTMSGGAITVGTDMYIAAHGPATFNLGGTGSISVVGTVHIGSSGGSDDPPAGTGTLNMSGGSINITGDNAHFVVADHGDGSFNFSGGSLTTKFYNIGQNLESGFSTRGIVNHTGGSATAQRAWVIGQVSQSANLYDLSGGSVSVLGDPVFPALYPGDLNVASDPDSRGTLMVRGTGVASLANSAFVGHGSSSAGTIIVSSNGSLALGTSGSGNSQLILGVDGAGNLQISGGNVSADFVTLGQNGAALGTGTQTGGAFVVRKNLSVGESSLGNNVYDISGGTMSVAGGIYVGTNGNGTLKVGGTALVTSALTIENAPTGGGTIIVAGGKLTAPSMNNRGLYSQGGGSASLGVVTGPGQMSVAGGSLAVASIAQGTLQLSSIGQVTMAPNGTNTGVSVVKNLSVTGSGKLDLNDNSIVVDYTGATPLPAVRAAISSAYAAGAWTGSGITSSAAPAGFNGHATALGYAEASDLFTSFPATFKGQSVDSTSVLVRYTLAGDSDLSGNVDLTDFTYLAANFNGSGKDWLRGDYTYDGNVDLTDFTFLASNFNQTLPAGAAGAASIGALVPEPASSGALVAAAAMIIRRRCFKRTIDRVGLATAMPQS